MSHILLVKSKISASTWQLNMGILQNGAFLSVLAITLLSLFGLSVPIALMIGTIFAGMAGGFGIDQLLHIFAEGTINGVSIALSYGFLGIFAAGLSMIGLPEILASKVINDEQSAKNSLKHKVRIAICLLLVCGICSQTIIPVHIAFIPIVVPALLAIFNRARIDRRAIACVLTFGLVATYGFLPFGFGEIFLREIVLAQMNTHGFPSTFNTLNILKLTLIPTLGMITGLAVALKFSYKKPRKYKEFSNKNIANVTTSRGNICCGLLAIVVALSTQMLFNSMVAGAFCGILVLLLSPNIRLKHSNKIVSEGFSMMSSIGMIMIIAAGYANVLSASGSINEFINLLTNFTAGNVHLTILLMLFTGLVITLGIGSSFSTVPILAAIFIPLCQRIGMSAEGTFIVLAVSGMLGDAGSAASDSTLGATAGLNIDGQHDHFKDSVIPTFIHFNIPLIIFGYLAAITFF